MTFYPELQSRTASERQALLQIPILQDALRGRIDRFQYVAFLTQAYHHVRHTAALLMGCGGRLPDRLDWLRAPIARYVTEEIGHEAWVLDDIAACGGDRDAVRMGKPAFETEVMVAYAYHQIDRRNPLGLFGMVHVLEGTSIAIATAAAESIRASLKLPRQAFTYLLSHGALDIEHVQFFEALMNKITEPEDQLAILDSARAFYRLYGDIFRALPRGSQQAA